ncbi:lytic transglycosylase domain-containing protein [Xanthomonas axonopodis pv. nakataecorchori]|uniref:lytic transglycosylase domain-containing protein n=1 Tax=Xanthomonas axonopodis TaxID=53413 RepID=UPI0035307744
MINSTIACKYVDKASNWQWEASSGLSPTRRVRAQWSGRGRRAGAGPQRILFAAALACAAPFARADCFEEAAGYQHVNPWVLRAIAWQESRGRADAIHRNNNGTVDYGKMQINSIHLRRLSSYGISRDALMHPCISVYVAAWRLREMTNKYGNTWAAVGAYHSETPGERDKYAHAIHSILLRRGVIAE